jgi:Domain of Unknown Function with PDB structure (DUF3857)
MNKSRHFTPFFLVFLLFISSAGAKEESAGWQPITSEEMAVKDCPGDPGCSAMILYREEADNDAQTLWKEYYRIKIFKDEGKKYADVEIPFVKDHIRVSDIEARTIEPDGTIVNFGGEVYEKTIVRGKSLKLLVKAFALPAIETGSIIEYRYTVHWGLGSRLATLSPWLQEYLGLLGTSGASEWRVQQELYTRRAHFSFHPLGVGRVMWTWYGLPEGVQPVESNGVVHMDVENIPALQHEELMPPLSMLESRVDFFYIFRAYSHENARSTDWYWQAEGKEEAGRVEKFIGKHKGIELAVDKIVSSSDSPDAKLRKLYDRVQQVRNLSFERGKTEKEEKREKLAENRNVEDVLNHGYGTGLEINLLFVALARAAALQAHLVEVAPRSQRMFVPDLLNWRQLSADVVEVRVGSQDLYFDPATRLCPYGLLPWGETESRGMRMEKGQATFAATPEPRSSDAVIHRKASLKLDAEGNLQGRVEVDFVGREALERRLDNRDQDEAGRRKALEDEVKGWLPAGATVRLKNSPDWETSGQSLSAVFETNIPRFATATSRRLLVFCYINK